MNLAPVAVNLKVSKHHDDHGEWEDHLILRVPAEVVNRMEKAVNNEPGAEELGINICDQSRNVQIRLGNQILPAKLLDLPTINEIHKTFDNKTIYKVTDVSQIIICDGALPNPKLFGKSKVKAKGTENNTPYESSEESAKHKSVRQIAKEKSKDYKYPHGITAPMKNAKKRKSRKKKEKKTMAVEEIEKELRRLLRSDLEAQSVRWEIVEDDGTRQNHEEDDDTDNYDPDDGSDDDKDDTAFSDDDDTL